MEVQSKKNMVAYFICILHMLFPQSKKWITLTRQQYQVNMFMKY